VIDKHVNPILDTGLRANVNRVTIYVGDFRSCIGNTPLKFLQIRPVKLSAQLDRDIKYMVTALEEREELVGILLLS
jgi:hypothetical protein